MGQSCSEELGNEHWCKNASLLDPIWYCEWIWEFAIQANPGLHFLCAKLWWGWWASQSYLWDSFQRVFSVSRNLILFPGFLYDVNHHFCLHILWYLVESYCLCDAVSCCRFHCGHDSLTSRFRLLGPRVMRDCQLLVPISPSSSSRGLLSRLNQPVPVGRMLCLSTIGSLAPCIVVVMLCVLAYYTFIYCLLLLFYVNQVKDTNRVPMDFYYTNSRDLIIL